MFDRAPRAIRTVPSWPDTTLPTKPLSASAQLIVDDPGRFVGLVQRMSFFEPWVRYIQLLEVNGLVDEADKWRARYAACCLGVLPEERGVVVQALKSYQQQKGKTAPL